MEAILAIIVEGLGPICCEAVVTGAFDLLVGGIWVRNHRQAIRARQTFEAPPQQQFWTIAYWVLMPVAAVGTLIFLVRFLSHLSS